MSTQLILFPQSYNSYAFTSTQNLNQYASNITFTSAALNTFGMSSYGTAWAFLGLSNYPATVGNWRLFYTDATNADWSATTIPTINTSTNTLTLYSSAGTGAEGSLAGVYQRLDGLTVGAQYTLTITHSSLPAGSKFQIGFQGFGVVNFDSTAIGNSGNSPTIIAASGNTTTTLNFTAPSGVPATYLSVAYNNTTNQTITISKISVTENPTNIPLTYNNIEDGQVICDLYQEEDIPLTLSVDNFKNAAEKTQSYSKDFDLPATKRNNKIFTHIFDVTKTIENVYDFNPYVRTKAILKQNGLLIFEGALRLIEIKDDNGEISYNVNLFAETIALKETLEGRTFAALNLEELNHGYDYTNITLSWEGEIVLTNNLAADSFALVPGLATNKTNVIKYPFCDWVGNIDVSQAEPELSRLEDAFRPWISVKYLLDNIARDSGYTFQSDFFDSSDFAKLYMDFNWGSDGGPTDFSHTGGAYYKSGDPDKYAATSATTWHFENDASPDTFDADTGWDLANNKFVCQANNTIYDLTVGLQFINVTAGVVNVNYIRFVRNNLSGVFGAVGTKDYFAEHTPATHPSLTLAGGTGFDAQGDYLAAVSIPLGESGGTGDELYIEWEADTASAIKQKNVIGYNTGYNQSTIVGRVYNSANFVTSAMFNTERGQIKQWDFIKGLMTMFNLISMPDPNNPNNIIFEPYADIFISDTAGTTLKERSIKHDWTDKMDISKIDLKPMDLKRKVIFKYAFDEEDYALKKYRLAAQGFEYGSMEYNGSTAIPSSNQVTNLVGEEEIIAEPFSATIIKAIQDNFPLFIIPVIYGGNDNGGFGSINNLPRILYNNGKVSQNYDVPGQNGVVGGIKTEYLQFSHFSYVPADDTANDYNFGSCPLFDGVAGLTQPILNLYNVYHAPYFNELYNENTRIMTVKVNLNAADINTFDFRDKVMIKNRAYRVNKIDYKPNALSTVEFILIP